MFIPLPLLLAASDFQVRGYVMRVQDERTSGVIKKPCGTGQETQGSLGSGTGV